MPKLTRKLYDLPELQHALELAYYAQVVGAVELAASLGGDIDVRSIEDAVLALEPQDLSQLDETFLRCYSPRLLAVAKKQALHKVRICLDTSTTYRLRIGQITLQGLHKRLLEYVNGNKN